LRLRDHWLAVLGIVILGVGIIGPNVLATLAGPDETLGTCRL
jgi:hypothetical protein